MALKRKDLLAIKDLDADELNLILDTAESFKEVATRDIKKVPTLRGKTVINLFFEPSTRTRTSFELAAKRLSADVINFSVSTSSVVKGESLLDTAKNLQAMNADLIVIRHRSPGAPQLLARVINSSIINAGDGAHEHPTQALLDLFTLRERKGSIQGLKIAIVGDIAYSRVARSDLYAFTKLGAEVRVVGPATMIPSGIEELGATVYYHLDEALYDVDAVIMLRLQRERQGMALFPTLREYSKLYCLTLDRLHLAKRDVLVLHPGPINRGVEIAPEVADGLSSLILDQVTNGIAVRMAVLFLLSGGKV
jgi:aspartate carbamoyltransferase catalytic subunit